MRFSQEKLGISTDDCRENCSYLLQFWLESLGVKVDKE